MTVDTLAWPTKTREFSNFLMDSTRWNGFEFRDNDIVISTFSKTGTTLVQQMVSQLVLGGDPAVYGQAESPWLDFRLTPDAVERAKAQAHRRFMKTHLPLNALVFSPKAKYIYIGRDARDILWSLHHHMMSMTPEARAAFARLGEGIPQPPPPDPDVRAFYNGYLDHPMPDTLWSHVQGWWDIRDLPNVLLLHYADLIADIPGQLRGMAAFLDITIDEARFADMVAHCSLAHMRKAGAEDPLMNLAFKGGTQTFINKGTNGRWRDVLSQAEIDKCDEIAARELTPDCAAWLRHDA
ncbi:MAG TPA: sulfotransferase domain-containing protein [Phenylobacterium sp.]|nr:sulfotransferase domain-containing protein [Phenylobacterium sp.]